MSLAAPADGIADLLATRAAALGDRPFCSLPDGRLTYRELDRLASRTGAVLLSLGVGPGSVVPVLTGNRLALVAAWFACSRIGAVFAPVNALLVGEPLAEILRHGRSAVALCDVEHHAAVEAVRLALPRLRDLVVTGSPVPAGARSLEFELARVGDPVLSNPRRRSDAATKLLYTSGTTGTPKGVLWTRRCETVWAQAYGDELLPIDSGAMLYTCLPLAHVTAQGTLVAALWRGGQVTVDAGFDPFRFWSRLRKVDAVAFTFVGTILAALADRPRHGNDALNPVQWAVGAATPPDSWRAFERRFGLRIVETWGQTETASCWMGPASRSQRPGTVGVPSSRFTPRLVQVATGQDVVPGTVGELWMRPQQRQLMFERYLDEARAAAWSADGWYRTGDLMRQEEDGSYVYVGRIREAIRRRGEMIPAGTVERAALSDPGVLEAAAVGVPDDRGLEEEIKLCIVPRPGAHLDLDRLHNNLLRRLPAFMVPRFIELRDALPKTPSTRVRRVELAETGRAGAWDARARRRPARAARGSPVGRPRMGT